MGIDKRKIQFFEKHLADFFYKAGRVELPWRKPFDDAQGKGKITAYEVWVSEIMLQQTQVVRVIVYYKNFLKRFPTVADLAKASWEEFLPYYQGLGYYARGRNMLKTAQVIVSEYRGRFPQDKALLEKLPGVGPYTAAAIMSFAYGENHLAWDTNLKRVIGRFFLGGKHLVTDEGFWETKFTLPKKDMNAALMDFGSALCVARPKCEACFLKNRCVYYKEGGKREVKTVSSQQLSMSKKLPVQVVVFLHEGHRKYFSSEKKKYAPFLLPEGCVTRAAIKDYFAQTYQLTLSVRPPHRKVLIGKKLTLLVNAQILLGDPQFSVFSKTAVKEYTEGSF